MMRPRNLAVPLVLCVVLAVAVPLQADIILLRNGQSVEGQVVRQNRTTVYLRTESGVQAYSKTQIRRVLYGDSAKAAALKEQREAEARRRAAERQRLIEEERRKAESERLTREEAAKAKREEEARLERERKEQEAARLRDEAEKQKQAEALERKREAAEAERKRAEAEQAKSGKTAEAGKTDAGKSAKSGKTEEERVAMLRRKEEEARRGKSEGAGLSPFGALLRSAAVPGWGQWSTGRKAAGGAYAALAAGGLYLTYDARRLYQNSLRDYGALGNPFTANGLVAAALGTPLVPSPEALANPAYQAAYSNTFADQRDAVDRHYVTFRRAGMFLGLMYAFNLADAYFGHPDTFGKGPVSVEPVSAALWSAAYPGLGQWRSGRRGEAALYGFLFSAAVFAAYDSRREYFNARREYERKGNPYEADTLAAAAISGRSVVPGPLELQNPATAIAYDLEFREARSYMDRKYAVHRLALLSAVGIYAWAVADAYLFHPGRAGGSDAAGTSGGQGGPEFVGFQIAVLPAQGPEHSGRVGLEGQAGGLFRF